MLESIESQQLNLGHDTTRITPGDLRCAIIEPNGTVPLLIEIGVIHVEGFNQGRCLASDSVWNLASMSLARWEEGE